MFVEHITIYNFDVEKESEAIEQYRKVLSDWECIQRGTRVLSLHKHESTFVNLENLVYTDTDSIHYNAEKKIKKDWNDLSSDEMTLEQARQAVKELRKLLLNKRFGRETNDNRKWQLDD